MVVPCYNFFIKNNYKGIHFYTILRYATCQFTNKHFLRLVGFVLKKSKNLYFFEEYVIEDKHSSGNLKTKDII